MGFTHRELRDYVEDVRSRLLQVKDVSKIEVLGAQDEAIFVEFSTQQLAGLGIDQSALISALQAQNLVSPSGTIQTGNENLSLRVSGAFDSEQDILGVNFVANGRLIRLRDIAEVHRAYADPPQPMFRVNGKPAIGLAIAMRKGGYIHTDFPAGVVCGVVPRQGISDSIEFLNEAIQPGERFMSRFTAPFQPKSITWSNSGDGA